MKEMTCYGAPSMSATTVEAVEICWGKRAFNKLQRTINSLFAATRCPHYRRASGKHYRYKNVLHFIFDCALSAASTVRIVPTFYERMAIKFDRR